MKDSAFEKRNRKFVKRMGRNKSYLNLSKRWFIESLKHEYSYHFRWLGRPIIQYPQDIIAFQEIIWQVKPDLIIETGIARGGSLIFSASLLELLGKGHVLGIDIDIRKHNKVAIEKHFLSKRIKMIEGSSIDKEVIKKVYKIAKGKRVLLSLDSNHTHEHVFQELIQYSPLVPKGSYLIVFDTVIDDMPKNFYNEIIKRPWGKNNNPKTAVFEFLKINKRFKIDNEIDQKLGITAAPSGYLKCIR